MLLVNLILLLSVFFFLPIVSIDALLMTPSATAAARLSPHPNEENHEQVDGLRINERAFVNGNKSNKQ